MRTTRPGDWVRICVDSFGYTSPYIGKLRWEVVKLVRYGAVLRGYSFGPVRSWIISNP